MESLVFTTIETCMFPTPLLQHQCHINIAGHLFSRIKCFEDCQNVHYTEYSVNKFEVISNQNFTEAVNNKQWMCQWSMTCSPVYLLTSLWPLLYSNVWHKCLCYIVEMSLYGNFGCYWYCCQNLLLLITSPILILHKSNIPCI